jgi:Uma2 family endonuclease
LEAHGIRHVRPVRPVRFLAGEPEWELAQGFRHGRLCEVLHQILRALLGPGSTVGMNNFVHFDASDPRRKCAPDGFVKLDVPHTLFDSFKTWEHGAPELCVEILSRDTEEKLTLQEKLELFHTIGVSEVVVFEVDAPAGRRIRAWDRADGDLVERVVEEERAPSLVLGKWFVIAPHPIERLPEALRLAYDPDGSRLVLDVREQLRADTAALRAETEALRAEKEALRVEKEALRVEKEASLGLLTRSRRGTS